MYYDCSERGLASNVGDRGSINGLGSHVVASVRVVGWTDALLSLYLSSQCGRMDCLLRWSEASAFGAAVAGRF